MIEQIAPFVEAGFACHWLHPREKRPIGDDWQNKPVATLDSLRSSYRPSNNVGVRLGEFSRLAGGYLHVLDMDIRLAELSDEAWSALRDLLPGIDFNDFPTVQSGSGGESRHIYFVTDRPFRKKALAKAEGKHRDPITQKWRCDWEIDLFGTGVQAAMPPSIHPDTGKPYVWLREFDFDLIDLGITPEISSDRIESLGAISETEYAFEAREPLEFRPSQMEQELDLIPVSDLSYDDWITLGQAIHHQTGASEAGWELWLEHTRRSIKHDGDERTMRRKWRSFGRHRGKPVTMATVRQWAIEVKRDEILSQFDEEDDEPAPSADEFEDLLGETPASPPELDWKSLLDFNEEGIIKSTLHNLRLIVENDDWTKKVVAYNEFTQEVVQRGKPGRKKPRRNAAKATLQLGGASWDLTDPVNGDFWTEDKDNAIRALIEAPKTQGGYGIKVPDRDLRAAIDIVGRKNGFHPVREYLEELRWDRKPRVEQLFQFYLGAPDDAYTRSVSRLMMIAGVMRVCEPGSKFDFAVILEGLQGKRKSTFISTLAKSWFAELDGDFEDARAMVEAMQGAWILEIPELSGFAKADVRHIKAFISRRSDKVRLAYAKRAQQYDRQCIFIGSTNDDRYLKDDTGGRRYWPIQCTVDQIDTDHLSANIDQLWAEAKVMYRNMRKAQPKGMLPIYLADDTARDIAERLQESRRVEGMEDSLIGQISEWLCQPVVTGDLDDGDKHYRDEVCLAEIWAECFKRDPTQYIGTWPATLGRTMRRIPGWEAATDPDRKRFGKYGLQRYYIRGGNEGKIARQKAELKS